MPISLHIKDDLAKLEKVLMRHEKSLMKRAVPSAINKTITKVGKQAILEISKTTGFTKKKVRSHMVKRRASGRNFRGAIDFFDGRAKNLIEFVEPSDRNRSTFRERSNKSFKHQGVRATAWGKTKTYKGSFIGRGKNSGKMLVFARRSSGKLKALRGPSIRKEFNKEPLRSSLDRLAARQFRKQLSISINDQIRKQK